MTPRTASKLLPWVLVALLVCLAGPVLAEDEKPKKEQPAAGEQKAGAEDAEAGKKDGIPVKEADETYVFTNDDLERLTDAGHDVPPTRLPPAGDAPAATPAPAPAPPAKPGDALEWLEQNKARAAERAQRITDAEKAVADARARVQALEKRLLSLRNPYSARPQIPDDEKAEWDELSTRDRVEKTQRQLEEARGELASAERLLEGLRASAP